MERFLCIRKNTLLCVVILLDILQITATPTANVSQVLIDYNLPRSSLDSSPLEPVLLLRMRSKTSACPTLLKRAPPCQESLLSTLIRFTATWNCLSRSFIKSSNVLIFWCARPSSTRSSDFRRSPWLVAMKLDQASLVLIFFAGNWINCLPAPPFQECGC